MKKISDKFHQRALTLIMFLMIFASIVIALKLEKVGTIFHLNLERSIPYYTVKFQFMSILAIRGNRQRETVSILYDISSIKSV